MKLLLVLVLLTTACSTSSSFRIPEGTDLYVNGKQVVPTPDGVWKTRPFFWSSSDGVTYQLFRGQKLTEEGKLPTAFRAVSIFWPPFAIIYWPMGFEEKSYDLTTGVYKQSLSPAGTVVARPPPQPAQPKVKAKVKDPVAAKNANAEDVKVLEKEPDEAICKKIGELDDESWRLTYFHSNKGLYDRTLRKLKAQTAKMGGNALHVKNRDTTMMNASMEANAYLCKPKLARAGA